MVDIMVWFDSIESELPLVLEDAFICLAKLVSP